MDDSHRKMGRIYGIFPLYKITAAIRMWELPYLVPKVRYPMTLGMASGSLGHQFSTTKRSLRGNTLDCDICINIVLNSCYEILDVIIIDNRNNSQSLFY